jgi:MFS family permease
LTDTVEKQLSVRGSSSLLRPLRVSTFRNLLVADVVSDIGAFMQNVGAAWLMVSLGAGPIYVALTQTAASLPHFLLALPAGSAGDIFDRRKLVLATESWMMGVALLLAVLTIGGFMSPVAAARINVCTLRWRCVRDSDMAGNSARISAEGRHCSSVCA